MDTIQQMRKQGTRARWLLACSVDTHSGYKVLDRLCICILTGRAFLQYLVLLFKVKQLPVLKVEMHFTKVSRSDHLKISTNTVTIWKTCVHPLMEFTYVRITREVVSMSSQHRQNSLHSTHFLQAIKLRTNHTICT